MVLSPKANVMFNTTTTNKKETRQLIYLSALLVGEKANLFVFVFINDSSTGEQNQIIKVLPGAPKSLCSLTFCLCVSRL